MKSKKKTTPCWRGYIKQGTKKKGGKTVNNCVKKKKYGEGSTNSGVIANYNNKGITHRSHTSSLESS